MDNLDFSITKQAGFCDLTFLWLELTAKCNLECGHCYASSGPRQDLLGSMDTDDWLTIIGDSADLGCEHVQFIGGEPTLHPDLTQMIAFASTKGYTFIEVFTNATAISDRLVESFVKDHVGIATSFYSNDAKTHDAITKRKGSFDRTVAGLKRMIGAGLSVRAGIIETEQNVDHAPRAQRFLNDLGVTEITTDFQRPVGRASTSTHTSDPMAALCGQCWKGKLCVSSSGRAHPCVFSRLVDVGRANRGIRELLAGQVLADFRRRYRNYVADRSLNVSADSSCEPTCSPPGRFCVPGCAPGQRCNPSAEPCTPVTAPRLHTT